MRALLSLLPLLLLTLLAAPSFAAEPPQTDFSGVWSLDPKASDSLDEIMTALGRSFLERKVVARMKVTQTITQNENVLQVDIDSSLKDGSETLKLDGSPTTITNDQGHQVSTSTSWSADGLALITTSEAVMANGNKGKWVVTRTLLDQGRTLRQRLELHLADGRVLAANRILRKKA